MIKTVFMYFVYSSLGHEDSISTKILVCQHVPKKSAVLACLTMAKLIMNQRVPNKNADLLKKISLMGTEREDNCRCDQNTLCNS